MSLTEVLAEDDPDIQLVAWLALKRSGFIVRGGASGYVTQPFDALSRGQQVKDIVATSTP